MTDILDQITNDQDDFFTNPDRRCPCVLLVDKSYSMEGAKIAELNKAMKVLHQELSGDAMAEKRVDMAIVSFGPVEVEQNFATLDKFQMPELQSSGGTPMGEAIERALKMIDERYDTYKNHGLTFYAPWVFMITDGEATDDVSNAISAIRLAEKKRKLSFFPIGVDDADMSQLASLSRTPAMKLNGLAFTELARFISISMRSVIHSNPGETINLPNPEATGFAQIVVS